MRGEDPHIVEPDLYFRTSDTLDRIAATLQVTVSSFIGGTDRSPDASDDAALEDRETLELVRLFAALRDPGARLHCLNLVRAHVEGVSEANATEPLETT